MPNNQKPASQAAESAPAAQEKTDFKKEYENSLGLNLHNEAAKSIAKKIFSQITAGTVSSDFEAINKKIAEAAGRGDTDKILELSAELKKIKDSHKTHETGYAQLRNANKFPVILQAYKADIENLAYEIAYTVLTSTHVALSQASTTKGKRGPNKAKDDNGEPKTKSEPVSFTITKDGKSVNFIKRGGRGGANLTQDKEALEFLGFRIQTVGGKEVLDPFNINLNGKPVKATRTSILDAIKEAKDPMFKGYTAVLNNPAE